MVELQVANHAKRVDFRFDPTIVVMEDELGQRYPMAVSAQKLIDKYGTSSHRLAADVSLRRKIVFDIPRDLTQPRLRIAFGGRIGEFADWFLYGNRWLEIPEKVIPPTNGDPK